VVQPRCCRPRCRVWHARAYHAERAGLLAVWRATSVRPRTTRSPRCLYTRGTAPQQTRAWKLFLLAPRLLLHRPREQGTVGREALLQRSRDFFAGRWDALLAAARATATAPRAGSAADATDAADDEAFRERRRALACANVRRGEVSRARGTLTSAAIAPGTDQTLAALSDPERRPPVPLHDVPAALLSFQPDSPAVLTDAAVAQCCRARPRKCRGCPGPVPPHGASQARRRRPRHRYGRHFPSSRVAQPCSYVCRHLRRGNQAACCVFVILYQLCFLGNV